MTLMTLAALVCLAQCSAAADEREPLPGVGTRVRVQAPGVSSGRLIGTLEDVTSDKLSLWVEDQEALVRVPLEAVEKIEVSRGRKSLWKSVLIGAGIMAAIGAATRVAEPCNGSACTHYPDEGALGGAVIGAAAGLIVGALGGERWRPIAPDRLRVGLAPTRRRGLARR
jgi:hypothetical protein